MRTDIAINSSLHSWYRAGSLSTVLTMFAPCFGGLEYRLRMMMSICDMTFLTASCEPHVSEKVPTRSPYKPRQSCISKAAECVGILLEAASGKALVGGVEPTDVVPLSAHSLDLVPLLGGRVDTCRVVCSSVQHDD